MIMETVCLFIFISYLWGTYVRKQLRIILLILENIDIKLSISIKMSFEMLSLFEYVVIEIKIIYSNMYYQHWISFILLKFHFIFKPMTITRVEYQFVICPLIRVYVRYKVHLDLEDSLPYDLWKHRVGHSTKVFF